MRRGSQRNTFKFRQISEANFKCGFPPHSSAQTSQANPPDCAACVEKLEKQIERDEKAVRIPGARDLLGETRVTLAIIQNRDTKDVVAARTPAPEDAVEPMAGKGGKGKAAKMAKVSAKGGKKGKKHK